MSRQPRLIQSAQPIKGQTLNKVAELLRARGAKAFQRDDLSPLVQARGEIPKQKAPILPGLKLVAYRPALRDTADVPYRRGL